MKNRPEEIHGGKRGNKYDVDPSVPIIVETPGHQLHDPTAPQIPPRAMIDSIKKHGVMVPGRCVSDGGRLLVEDGRTRLRAVRIANAEIVAENFPLDKDGKPILRLFPYILGDRYATDTQQRERKTIVNFHRREHNAVEVAIVIAEYSGLGYSEEQIAALLGLTVAQVKGYGAVNRCSPVVVAKIASGELDVRKAPALAKLTREEQEKRVSEPRAVKPPKPRALSAGKVAKIREALFDDGRVYYAQLIDVLTGGPIGDFPEWLADLIRGALAAPTRPDRAPTTRDYGTRKDGTPRGKPGRKPTHMNGERDLL